MKAVHFGAGNIGLGFIGLLLSQSGYDVQFVDVSEERVALINERKKYTVKLASEAGETFVVEGVSALNGRDEEQVARAIAEADIVTTAVGVSILPHLAGTIAKGIQYRLEAGGKPFALIACENAIGGSTILKEHVFNKLPAELGEQAKQIAFFPDAAVDRIVPIQQHEDPLQVTVEPFYEWVIDRSGLPEGFPELEQVHYVDKLEPYIERKLFTVNTGHCCAAYFGYLRGYTTIQEAMQDEQIVGVLSQVLAETGSVIVQAHGFDSAEHQTYIQKILDRFRNPYLTDEVVRVGRSPLRKLSQGDRLIRPARLAEGLGIETPGLIQAIAAALSFDYKEDPEALELQRMIQDAGIASAVTSCTGIAAEHPLHQAIIREYKQLHQGQEG